LGLISCAALTGLDEFSCFSRGVAPGWYVSPFQGWTDF